MNRALRMTDKELEAQAVADALAAELENERRIPVPRLPRDAEDFPICDDCCFADHFVCCSVHGVRSLPGWLRQWFNDLQNRRDHEIDPRKAAAGYWSHAVETIIVCPECQRKLVAPSERVATVRCPKCLGTWKLPPNDAERSFRANDTLADRSLKELSDTVTDRPLSQDTTVKNQAKLNQSYEAYLEFGADFNWD